MARALPPLLAAAAALSLAACGSGDDPAPAAVSSRTVSSSCAVAPRPGGGRPVPCPTPTLVKGKRNVVVMRTSEGTFDITLATGRAPQTANSFAYLAKRRFFDGLRFHRVVKHFVIQGGDPNGDGSGGPGYTVTEAPPPDLAYTRGVVAMAKTATEPAGASGSQFFVVSAHDIHLPPEYALVGRVTRGLRVVDAITALSRGDGVPPRRRVTITSATLVAR